MTGLKQSTAQVGDLNVSMLEQGEGPLLLCLHGFPDSPHGFAAQLDHFARAGYRVVAPFMRGYAPTSAPERGPFTPAALARDALGVMDALGYETAALYGHDWGTAAAYGAAVLAPERVTRLIAASVPYGHGIGQALLSDPDQQRRSWYMFFFQLRFAETAVAFNDLALIETLWRDWSPGWTPPPERLEAAKEALRPPGALAAALGYYRAALSGTFRDEALRADDHRINVDPITVPTLYLHGADDGCIASSVSDSMQAFVTGPYRREIVPSVGHFVHQEAPEVFNALVSAFLAESF